MDRPVAAIFVHRPFIVLFHVVLDDLQLLFPDIGAQRQSAGVAAVIGDIARFQIEQQPRKSRHRPDREGDHLAVRNGVVFQVDRVPGAVVQPDPCMPETLEEGLGFALAVKGGDGKDKSLFLTGQGAGSFAGSGAAPQPKGCCAYREQHRPCNDPLFQCRSSCILRLSRFPSRTTRRRSGTAGGGSRFCCPA